MSGKVTITNPTTTPTVYSEMGHVLEAGGRSVDVVLDGVGREAVRLGYLAVDTAPPATDDSPVDAKPTTARRSQNPPAQVP